MRFAHLVGALALMLIPLAGMADTRLLMGEQPGCHWCEQWHEEIGPIYPKTVEGKAAPLQRFDIFAPPEDVILTRQVNFTPTFILVQDGRELNRIEGYPGEDFFWGLLGQMLESAGIQTAPAG